MSERIPTAEDIRLALTTVGYTEDEAAEGIDRIKKRCIGIGHEMAREAMQASIGAAFRKAQAIAWGEGFDAGEGRGYDGALFEHGIAITEPEDPTNPYREEAGL